MLAWAKTGTRRTEGAGRPLARTRTRPPRPLTPGPQSPERPAAGRHGTDRIQGEKSIYGFGNSSLNMRSNLLSALVTRLPTSLGGLQHGHPKPVAFSEPRLQFACRGFFSPATAARFCWEYLLAFARGYAGSTDLDPQPAPRGSVRVLRQRLSVQETQQHGPRLIHPIPVQRRK